MKGKGSCKMGGKGRMPGAKAGKKLLDRENKKRDSLDTFKTTRGGGSRFGR